MALRLEDGRGLAFPNSYKEEGDNKPDFTGEMRVFGQQFRVSIWKGLGRNGGEVLSIRQNTQPGQSGQPAQARNNEDVPF